MSAFHMAVASTVMGLGVGMTMIGRSWPAPGRHRAPSVGTVIDEVSLDELLDGGEVEANDFLFCPAERRTTFHAVRVDGSRRCWTCACETAAGVA